jgi:hypothetical protein
MPTKKTVAKHPPPKAARMPSKATPRMPEAETLSQRKRRLEEEKKARARK